MSLVWPSMPFRHISVRKRLTRPLLRAPHVLHRLVLHVGAPATSPPSAQECQNPRPPQLRIGVTWRRTQMVLLSAQGMDVSHIAQVIFARPDRIPNGLHNFNLGHQASALRIGRTEAAQVTKSTSHNHRCRRVCDHKGAGSLLGKLPSHRPVAA